MSSKKYLRLAGFDHNRVAGLREKNAIVSKIFLEMITHANRMIGSNNGALGNSITAILEKSKTETVPCEILRACYRIQSLMRAISTEQCILGRNNFLDGLNIKQVTFYLTNMHIASSPLGVLSRTLPQVL